MGNKRRQVVSGVVALSLTCTLLPGHAMAAWTGPNQWLDTAYVETGDSYNQAAEKKEVRITQGENEKFILAAKQGNTRIYIEAGAGLVVKTTPEAGGVQNGRMKPALFGAGTEVIGGAGSSITFWSPMQLAGDDVSFKDLTMEFVSADGIGSVPHREIFLAGHSLTFDNVVTDNPNGGSLEGFGGSEENLLPLVFAGGYQSIDSNNNPIGTHAMLTVKNAREGKTRFQAIYLSHDEKLSMPKVQAPIATDYTGPVTLELDAKTEVMDGSKGNVNFPSGIFAEHTTSAQIKFTGNARTSPLIPTFTLSGNNKTSITLENATLGENSRLKDIEKVEVGNQGVFELGAGSTVTNVVLNAGGELKPHGSAVINGDLTGGGTIYFTEKADLLDIKGNVTGQTAVEQWMTLGVGHRISTNQVPADSFRMSDSSYIIVPQETDGRIKWIVKDASSVVAPKLGSVMIKLNGSYGPYEIHELTVDLSKLQEQNSSEKFWLYCFDSSNQDINANKFNYEDLLHVVAVKSAYWKEKDAGIHNEATDWAGDLKVVEAAGGTDRYQYELFVGNQHTQAEDYVLLFFKDVIDVDTIKGEPFGKLVAEASPEKLAGQLTVHLTDGTTPVPPVPPTEATFSLNVDAAQPVFGDQIKFSFETSEVDAKDKKVTLFANGQKLAEETVVKGKAELTYDTKDHRKLLPGENVVKAVYSDSTSAASPDTSNAETTVTVQAKPLVESMFQNIDAQTFNGGELKPAVTPDVSGDFQDGDYTVSYRDNINAGTDTAVAVIQAAGKGYYSGTAEKTFTINKASYGDQTAQSSSKYGAAGSLDLTNYLCEGAKVGAVTVTTDDQKVIDGAPAVADGKNLTYQLKADVKDHIGATAVISIPVTSSNYADYTITVTVTVADKLAQNGFQFANAAVDKIYSDADFIMTAAGAAAGSTVTYQSSKPDVAVVDQSTGKVTITGVGSADITATAAATADYAQATAVYTLKVEKGTIRITAKNKSACVGDTAPALGESDYTVDGLHSGETLKTKPVIQYASAPDMSKAGTVAIQVSGATVEKDGCYNLTYIPGTLTISPKPDGGSRPSPNPGNGGSGGGSNVPSSSTETTKHPDGSTTTTVTKPDGSKVETTQRPNGDKTVVETKRDGSSVTKSQKADGTTATTTVDKNGVMESEVKLSSKAVKESAQKGRPVELPTPPVEVTRNSWTAPVVKVDTGSQEKVEVRLPVKRSTPGTVAVVVHKDGTEEVIRKSVVDPNGVTFAVAGEATIKVVENSKVFEDTRGHWAQDAIDFATSHELYNGTSESTFSPDQGMTRGMLAVVLHNLENNPKNMTAGSFGDVKQDDWYADSIQWATEKGIVSGYGNGSFGPNDQISREQLAVMLWRYSGSPQSHNELNFADSAMVSDYAQDAMKWAVKNGIISGTSSYTLSPKDTATRAQVATMMMNLMENIK